MQLDEVKKPKIVVLCNGKFALPAIQILGIEKFLCGIGIGNVDESFGSLLEQECEKSGLAFKKFPFRQHISEMRKWLDDLKPDFIFSICFPYKLTADILEYKEKAFLNFHTGPLPQFRGAMPIFEVIRYREKSTSLTVHYMQEEFDNGPIIFEEKLLISENETFGSLALKLSEMSGFVAQNMAQMLQFATHIPTTIQNESNARYFEYPIEEDTQIRWKYMSAGQIEALIRACNPWNKGVETIINGQHIRLLSAVLTEQRHETIPGQILGLDNNRRLLISCIDGECIAIKIMQTDYGFCTAEDFFLSSPNIKVMN